MVVRVYIVRHGETQENMDGVIQGQRDTALNANGEGQAWMVGEALKDAKIGVAFSSDLSRAVKVRGFNHKMFSVSYVNCITTN
jgi:probable phosphoglycerate mutase